MRLEGKVALVTGAAKGIGESIARHFAAVAVMLASNESGYMTGAEINIDGGILAGSAGTPDS